VIVVVVYWHPDARSEMAFAASLAVLHSKGILVKMTKILSGVRTSERPGIRADRSARR